MLPWFISCFKGLLKTFQTLSKVKKLTPKAEAQSESTSLDRLRELAQDPKLAKLVAGNYMAPPDLLEELSHTSDKPLLKALVSNPNTPTEVLLKLGSLFPEQLLDNPVFDILLIENPNLLSEFPKSSLNSLLKREVAPVSFLRWAATNGDENTLQSLLINPNVPVDAVQGLTQHRHWDVAMAAKLHINSGVEMDSGWEEEGLKRRENQQGKVDDRLADLFGFVRTESKDLVLLSESLRLNVASNPNSPAETLTQLATDKHVYVMSVAAKNPNCPVEVLTQLATDKIASVRLNVASNPNCPVELLTQLATDKNWNVRHDVAKNSHCPVDVLTQLATDESLSVRRNVAGNPNCPVEVLSQLAVDKDRDVRRNVASNPNCPVELRLEILTQLAADESLSVRRNVAGNPNCPVEVLIQLAVDKDRDVRRGVASNLNCPVEVLTQLALDNNLNVRRGVASSLNCPPADLIVDSFLEQFTKSSIPTYARLIAFRSPHCPTGALAKNYRSRDWLERCAIAEHPKTPDATLQKLLLDGNRLVRQKAQTNLNQRKVTAPED
jgi:hypothetical protein